MDSLSFGMGTSTSSTPQVDVLAREIDRLHSQLCSSLEMLRIDIRDFRDFLTSDLDGLSSLKVLRIDIRDFRDFLKSDLDGLRLIVRGILSQLDVIRTQLQSRFSTSTEPVFVQPITFHPPASSSLTRPFGRR